MDETKVCYKIRVKGTDDFIKMPKAVLDKKGTVYTSKVGLKIAWGQFIHNYEMQKRFLNPPKFNLDELEVVDYEMVERNTMDALEAFVK